MTVEVQVVVGEYEGQQRMQQKKLSIYEIELADEGRQLKIRPLPRKAGNQR